MGFLFDESNLSPACNGPLLEASGVGVQIRECSPKAIHFDLFETQEDEDENEASVADTTQTVSYERKKNQNNGTTNRYHALAMGNGLI